MAHFCGKGWVSAVRSEAYDSESPGPYMAQALTTSNLNLQAGRCGGLKIS